jgi:hypothetical protein
MAGDRWLEIEGWYLVQGDGAKGVVTRTIRMVVVGVFET